MRINVSEVLVDPDLGATTFTRKRVTTSYENKGEARNAYGDPVTLAGIVQPASTADMRLLPEGTRLVDVKAFFTSGDISAGSSSMTSDLLEYNGAKYRVIHVQAFEMHGMTKVLAQMIAAGTPPTYGYGMGYGLSYGGVSGVRPTFGYGIAYGLNYGGA